MQEGIFMNVILASGSPRRKELLGHLFPKFSIMPAEGEEEADFLSPSQYVTDLAEKKALEVARRGLSADTNAIYGGLKSYSTQDLTLILGADTIVYANGKVLGKPASREEAYEMLSLLSGASHKVYTGVCLLFLCNDPAVSKNDSVRSDAYRLISSHSFCEETEVFVDPLTPGEINDYIATGDPLDKAGSYGIQGPFCKHIRGISGDYFNVVGLPVSRISRELKGILEST